MSYCTKCGNKVEETMTFCPRCGAPLKAEAQAKSTSPPSPRREEKAETREKYGEKHEKREHNPLVYVMIGAIIIVVGLLSYMRATGFLSPLLEGPLIALVVGIAILVYAFYLYVSRRRFPPTSV